MGIKATFSLNQIGAQVPSSETVASNAVVYVDGDGDVTLYPLQELYDRIQGAEDVLESITNIYTSTINAAQVNLEAVDLVRQYANKQVDVPVEQGYFSAKHWATKAEDAYSNITVDAQGYIDSCQGILDNVETKSEYIDTVYLNTVNDANDYLSQVLDVYQDTDAIKTSVQGIESTVITKHNEVVVNTNTVSNLHDVVVAAESNVTQLKADTQILKGEAASSASDAQAAQSATATMRDEVTTLKESAESAANSAGSSLQSVTALSDQVAQDASQVTADKLAAQTAATNAQQSANAANAAKVSSEGVLVDVTNLKSDVQSIAATLAGGIVMRGEWDASSGNAPPAPDGNSEFYKITVPGVINGITYDINDNIVYDPTNLVWFKVDNTESVTSVNGKTGVVTLTKVDVGLNQVDNTSDADKPVSAATQNALDGKLDNDYVPTWNSLAGKPVTFAPNAHGHPWTEITGKPSTFNPVAHNHTWNEVTGKPETATRWPVLSEIGLNNVDNTSDLDKPISSATQAALDDKLDKDYVPTWNSLAGKPSTFTPTAHTHTLNNITDAGTAASSDVTDFVSSNVRKSLLDSPLCRLFIPNKLVDTLAGPLTWARATTATYVDRYGVVRTAAISEPREEKEGWLIEGQSTNLILQSEDFSSAAWSNGNAAVTADSTVAPDGANTADLIEDSSTVTHQHKRQVVGGISGNYTVSVYLKKGTSSVVTLASYASTDTDFHAAYIDLDTGDVLKTNGGVVSTHVKILSDGWFRISLVCNASVGQNVDIRVYPTDTRVGATFTTGTVYAWGAQLEALPFASSYIPTTTAPTTRAADVVSADGVNNISSLSDNFSITYTVSRLEFGGADGVPNYVFTASADDSLNLSHSFWPGADDALLFYYSGSLFFTTVGNEPQKQITATYNKTSLITYSDGNLTKSDDVAYTDASDKAVSLHFGSNRSGDQGLYGHLRDFRIYDFALNADEAQFLAGVK